MEPRKLQYSIALALLVLCVNCTNVKAHNCYQCSSDEDCEDQISIECPPAVADEKCYMRFDDISHDVSEMGCLSDYGNETEIIELVKKKELLVCKGNECNGFDNLPTEYECTKCSSNILEACATKPTTTTSAEWCRLRPYTQCYQRVTEGVTVRGCLFELEGDEFYNCLNGDDDNCKICKGNNCNEDIIPSDRLRCHRCNSESDTTCGSLPAASSVCPTYSTNDSCVAYYENDITKRGCATEFSCDKNSKNCQLCLDDNCNSANLKQRMQEVYGVFQALPLNCNTCSGDECRNGLRNPKKCEGNIYQDCLTIFSQQSEVLRRGCENSVMTEYQSYCANNPELCFNCKANGCNDLTNHKEYQECLYCDAASNPDCLFHPTDLTTTRKCALGCVSSLYRRKSNPSVSDFVRTCFEDIEHDERDSCNAINNCVQCTSDKCNNVILPEKNRLSCYHCQGDNCDDPLLHQCLGYAADDQCYIYFDNVTLSAVKMGCRSEFTKSDILADIKQFFICDGDNCNTILNLPDARMCFVCNSAEDENCAVDPDKMNVQKRCQNYPYTECFTRISDDGYTERGCLHDLAMDDFKTCHDGHDDSKCMICTQSACNKNVYPGDRQRCYRCDSSTDANCESSPKEFQACPIYQQTDGCITQWVEGITRRACSSELTCKGLSRKNCRTCSGMICNDINLADENIGPVGMFTALPLSCYRCNGTQECQDSKGNINVCQDNVQQPCTVAFNKDGNAIGRGCSDSLESVCDSEGNLCYDCKSNGCNVAKSEKDFVDCIHCDTKNGDDCVFNVDSISRTRKCYNGCMTALYPRTSDEEPAYELIRTCLDDKDLDERASCEASKDPKCKSCSGSKCNKDDVGSRKSCYQCQGEECQDPKIQKCRAVMDNDQCFVRWDEAGTLTAMGCKSQYDPKDVQTLVSAKFLWLCDADDCNHFDNLPKPQKCSLCNSLTDNNCTINPLTVLSTTECDSTPYTQCYSRILENGHTERGCLSNLQDAEFYNCLYNKNSTECKICTNDKCNNEIFPSNRVSCHICSSASSSSCETSPKSSQICLLYSSEEKCVTTIDGDGQTVRGCKSEISCDVSDTSTCQVCTGKDCNVVNLKRKSDGKPGQWQQLPLNCLACNSVSSCKSGSTEETCSNTEYCMTVFDVNGDVSKRGCSDAVEVTEGSYCDSKSDKCFNCNSNLCNVATSPSNYSECVYCNSESNSDCALNPLLIRKHRKCNGPCMTALYPITENSSVYEVLRTCLNDKDAPDQNICLSGSLSDCKACTGASCNVDLLPENRLSCFSCIGDDCENAQSSPCLKYKQDDQCYALFDNKSDVVQMGCISDLEEPFAIENEHLMFRCSSENDCNSFDNFPQKTQCVVCNSNNDANCASLPQDMPDLHLCSALPHTQCFTRINPDGSTERGCVNTLSKVQMMSCLTGENSDCAVCDSDGCNKEIFPANRRSCQRCNTRDDPNCEANPNAASVCPVYTDSQFCASKLVNGHTYRGCSTEFECDDSDKQYCRLCHNSDNCNTIDLASSEIGYPGKWQDVPINCYTCHGIECQSNRIGHVRKCEKNNLQNCVTVFAPNETVVERGCSDEIYNGDNLSYCDNNPGFCKFCKSSGCNFAIRLADYEDCLFCDGAVNSDCVLHPEHINRTRSCHKGCMTALYARSDEVNPAYELARGCLDDMDLDERDECKSSLNPYCQSCFGKSCNVGKIPNNRLNCNVCNGANCEEPESVECASFRENDQCFTLFHEENDVQRMGCASELDTSFLVSNRRQILLCNGDNCNHFDLFPNITSCRSCNSKDDPECASSPASSVAADCKILPHTECYVSVDKDGITHRGCLSDVDDTLFHECSNGSGKSCKVCTEEMCNDQLFPAGRRSCIQCDSSEFSACKDNSKQFGRTCAIYDENDSCITTLDGERIIRGCASEITCDTSSRDTCRICNRTDNCNTINLLNVAIGDPGKWQGLPLSCYNCDGAECANGNVVINVCQGNNMQTCTTVFASNGTVEKRGCSDAITSSHGDYCDENPEHCPSCKSVGCNTAKSLQEYSDCYFCDSADSTSCSINFDLKKSKIRKCEGGCMVALYPRTSANDTAFELARTCLNDMDLDDRNACLEGSNDKCKACTGPRCNTMSVPEERFECYTCLDDGCEDVATMQCSAYHPNDQCYTLYNTNNSIIAMGCRSEFEMDVVTELVKKKQMLLCNSKHCNSPNNLPTPKTCSVCNSEENQLCATNPNLVANIERCSVLPYSECFTRVNSYGHTVRGCLASLESETFYGCHMGTDELCEICVGDKCNEIDVFPSDRRRCQQCNSAADPLCATTPNNNKVCPIYKENDKCVTNLQNGITTRGCSSAMSCDDESDKRSCRICEDNGCNTVNLEKIPEDGEPGRWQVLPLTCYSCNGTEDCEGQADLRVCENNPYQNCLTIFGTEGEVTHRGCSDVVEESNKSYCENNPDKCFRCNSNGCNVAKSIDQYVDCLFCDIDSNGECVHNVAAIAKTRKCYKHCMTALYGLFEEEKPSYGLSRSCYDDMDLDDRESCSAGNKEFCQTCSSAKCNNGEIPEDRISCYICEGDSCQDPKPQKCSTYRPEDKCYMRYDEKQALFALGCRSEFSNQEADYLLQQKRLYICNHENCNDIDKLPTAQTCTLCNSRTDIQCAVNPSVVAMQTKCSVLPYTECYSRVLSDGATERGCLSNLYDDEFASCLNGTSATCKSCKGNDCNKDIFPADRLKCHICDSASDPNCESTPNSLSTCPLYNAEDACVTVFRNDVTYRGCTSEVECDATNPRKCVQCSGVGCNTVDLAKKQDDNFGKWQDLPLTCLDCKDDECGNTESTTTKVCELNNEQDCVTVFNTNGKVVRRGCADTVESELGSYCDTNDDSCFNCKSNKCNTAVSKTEYVECVYCDTNKNIECLWNPLHLGHKTRQCQDGCMTALYPSDSSTTPGYDMVRTCLNDKEEHDQITCTESKDEYCKACTDNKCNKDNVPEQRLSCFTCEGDSCEDPVTKPCALYKENDQCFIKFDDSNSVSEMGCLSSFRNQHLENIIKTKRVSVCSGDNCNSPNSFPVSQKCAVCSSADDVSCAVYPIEIGSFDTCNILPYTGCYSQLDKNGRTLRGCLTDLPEDDFVACVLGTDKKCGVCSGEGCNREIFPSDRQQCFTCNSEEESNCESYPTSKMACPIISDTEACITAINGNVTFRGCKSTIFCDANDSFTCRSCFGTECNSIDLINKVDDGYHGVWQNLPLKCHTCEEEQCLHSLGPVMTCSSRNINQDCMTVFKSDGLVFRRGCSDAVEDYKDLYCRQNPELCFKCKSNECNVAWSVSEYTQCAFCDSASNPLCVLHPETTTFASRKCYKECMVALKDQHIVRSCLDDKELLVQHTCQSINGNECATCTDTDCNKFVFPSDRLKCHVCTGSSCAASTSQYCELYDKTDFCFAKYENGQVDRMGCATSQNVSDIIEWEAQKKLYKCEGNDCNELSRLPDGGECIVCDSSKTPNCAQNPLLVTATETCLAPSEECVTRVNSQGHTIRGCLSSLDQSEKLCEGSGTCTVCSGSKCNNQIYPASRRSCHICNSRIDKDCKSKPNNPLICPIFVGNDSCVSSLDKDGNLERGCASQVTCEKNDKDYCETCSSNNCNIAELKGSAEVPAQSLILSLLLALAAMHLLKHQ